MNSNVLIDIVSVPDDTLRGDLIDITRLLIEYGIEIEHKNKWGISAVYEVVAHGFFELAEIFQSLGITLTSHISVNEFIFYAWPRHPSRKQRLDFPNVLKMLLIESLI